jgi:hypothetical protein
MALIFVPNRDEESRLDTLHQSVIKCGCPGEKGSFRQDSSFWHGPGKTSAAIYQQLAFWAGERMGALVMRVCVCVTRNSIVYITPFPPL